MQNVRIGLVGCGLFGESHLQTFRSVPQAQVTALFDIDGGRASKLGADFGIPRVCSSLEEICSLADLDAIDVVTTEQAHLEPVLGALSRGKHVFVEKPLATDLGHCAAMIEAARAAGRILMVGHTLRFETRCAMLKDSLAAGRLGQVVSMHARRNRQKSLLPRYGRTHPALENSIHDVDLMLWYTGRPVSRVRGYGRNATGGLNHDTFWGVLEFEGGAIGVVETIWLLPPQAGISVDDSFQLVGTAGVANLQLHPGPLSLMLETGYEIPDISYGPVACGAARGAMREELAYFVECVQTGREPERITALEGARAVRVVLALIESAETGRDVQITEWD